MTKLSIENEISIVRIEINWKCSADISKGFESTIWPINYHPFLDYRIAIASDMNHFITFIDIVKGS